jgi:hypothetical protein
MPLTTKITIRATGSSTASVESCFTKSSFTMGSRSFTRAASARPPTIMATMPPASMPR